MIKPDMPARRRIALLVPIVLALMPLAAVACSTADSDWPPAIRSSPAVVRQAYAFAVEHPEVLAGVPCYCGCGSIGHTSNLACFVAGRDDSSEIVYDEHALGCSICVDIALDAQRMFDQGLDLTEIRTQVDAVYSPFGPSNMP